MNMADAHAMGFGRRPTAAVRRHGPAFGVSSGDAEDYYDTIMSSDEDEHSDAEEANTAQPVTKAQDLSTLTLVHGKQSEKPVENKAIFQHVGGLGGRATDEELVRAPRKASDEFILTNEERERHTQRRSQLENALDAALGLLETTSLSREGEAPFRYRSQRTPVTSPAPTNAAAKVEGHGPQQSENAKKKKLGAIHETGGDDDSDADDELRLGPDPLYDDGLDDADEKWVQINLRAQGGTDATLCCPCCFLTVCMSCQRHVRYPNQYRARIAVNCRIQKDIILTYESSSNASSSAAEPQQRRHQLQSMAKTSSCGANRLLGENEYFGVACSDCGTTVGVYDHEQQYHFFNVLPSNN